MSNDCNPSIKIFITTTKFKAEFNAFFKHLGQFFCCDVETTKPFCEKIPTNPIDRQLLDLNKYYSEIITMYWAAKNVSSKYYGFFHYRRLLAFDGSKHKFPSLEENINEEYLCSRKIDDENIKKIVESCDIVLPYQQNLLVTNGLFSSLYKQYKFSYGHDIRDLENAINFIHQTKPEFDVYVNKAMSCKKAYFHNVFIMKDKYFKEYIEWLEPILQYVHKNKDYSNASTYEKRAVGFVAERLLNVFLLHLKDKYPFIKIKECQMIVFGSESSLDASQQKKIKLKISEYTKFGRILRCIYHTIIGK